jgi:hypothetical protein
MPPLAIPWLFDVMYCIMLSTHLPSAAPDQAQHMGSSMQRGTVPGTPVINSKLHASLYTIPACEQAINVE